MNQKLPKTWISYLGVAAAVAVPALVVAQQQRNPPADNTFAPGTLLRAADVEQLRDALADTIARVNTLESNAGVALTKETIYQRIAESAPVAQNANGRASATCNDANDIILGCVCEGRVNDTVNLQIDIRRVALNNFGDSTCTCQGVNVATDGTTPLVRAVSQCLPVPGTN